ncbi:hypothetical protein [Virgibacillus halodenitrificans]|uniref:hypothetical protein n=1 Tax=Virgibacillus halodenitrificans TaxID=1482 RepID=UPI000EF4785D|nr:hypothetical protein [Virgibacillus halodenitrificans]
MKALLFRFKSPISIVVGIIFIVILSACTTTNEKNIPEATSNEGLYDPQQIEPEQREKRELPSFENYDDYINYISEIPSFEPYYKTVFTFEELSGGIQTVPIEKLKSMYQDMNTTFDYVLVHEYPLIYRGNYEGNIDFVDEYEQSLMMGRNPVNAVAKDWEGNEYYSTPLKTVMLGESIYSNFDNSIDIGRNLLETDFTLSSPNEPISIVLGSAYKDVYEIGDIISLELISKEMEFEVVGFYKPDVSFSMDVGANHQVSFDYTIVMPHFIPNYEPVGSPEIFQHAFLIGELTSGHIRIEESIKNINDDTFDEIVGTMKEIAEQNGLSELYKYPYWPVGFVW